MYGYHRNTCPFVSQQKENRTICKNTYVSGVGTPTSFTGIFTGEHASATQLDPSPDHWTNANKDRRLLPEVLQEEGYYTGGFHYNALMSHHFGWDRGWDVYEDHMWSDNDRSDTGDFVFTQLQNMNMANFAVHSKKMIQGEMPELYNGLVPKVKSFIDEAPEPWFLWVLLIDTHHPYIVPKSYQYWPQPGRRTMYAWNFVMRRYRNMVGERREGIVNAYDNTIRYADTFVEWLWTYLKDNGHENIPKILFSDHGDEFGEHANYGHRPLMYDTVTRVPLLMWNVEGESNPPHTLMDLGNTVLNIAESQERLGEGQTIFDDREYVTIQNHLGTYGKCAAVVDSNCKTLYHPEGDWGHGGHISPGYETYRTGEFDQDGLVQYPYLKRILDDVLDDTHQTQSGEKSASTDVQKRLSELGYLE